MLLYAYWAQAKLAGELKTLGHMVIDHAAGLHIGIADSRPDKLKTALLEILAHGFRFRCVSGDIGQSSEAVNFRLAIDELPDISVKAAKFRLHVQEGLGIAHHAADFGFVADDACVLQQFTDFGLIILGDHLRLELVEGYITAFLNLDRVIEIIRYEDEPKAVMIEEFSLTDRQAEAILNMRLRSLRKLEEMELRGEKDELLKEQDGLEKLLSSPARQRTRLKRELGALRKEYGRDTALGRRRTSIEEAAPAVEFSMDAMIEKEPVTVILSQKGWVRGAKGHLPLDQEFKYKEGDGPAYVLHAQTTDKLLLATDKGRFFTLGADKLPGARGFGEPVRNTLDIDASAQIVAVIVHRPGQRLLLAADTGKGFGATTDDLLAETRKGRQVVNLKGDARLAVARVIDAAHDHVAVVGDNRKLVVFNLEELPQLSRGQGVTLQRYRDGGLSDAITFTLDEGLSWTMGGKEGRTRTEGEMWQWKVARGGAGRMPPQGFPRDNTFD